MFLLGKTVKECTDFTTKDLPQLPASAWIITKPKTIELNLTAAERNSAAARSYVIYAKDAAGNISFQTGSVYYCPTCKSATIPGGNSSQASELTTAIDEPLSQATFEVKAYPNPFTDNATISVTMGSEVNLKVDITDMTGSVVRTIYDGEPGASQLNLQWDGTNGQNRRVSPGVYFCRVNNQVIKLIRK